MRYEIYRTLALFGGRWRWRLIASNGRKIAVSGEGYHNREDMFEALDLVRGSAHIRIVEK